MLLDLSSQYRLCLLQFSSTCSAQPISSTIDVIREHPHPGGRALWRNLVRRERTRNDARLFGKEPFFRMRRISFDFRNPSIATLCICHCLPPQPQSWMQVKNREERRNALHGKRERSQRFTKSSIGTSQYGFFNLAPLRFCSKDSTIRQLH